MKTYLLIIIGAIFLIPFSGCKKKSFDPSGKSREDFIGTWQGSISTFKNNKSWTENGSVVIYDDVANKTLSGIIFMKETRVFHEFQFVDGTLYFKVINNDPTNPICQTWNLGGYAVFSAEGKLDIRITGNECGQIGSEFVNWVGAMVQTQVSADSVKYYNFAKSGNSWSYKITLRSEDTCVVQRQVNQVSASYLFSGATSQTCGWAGQTWTFKWNVTPAGFSIVNDSTISYKPITFPIDAKPGVVYNSYIKNDTITVTLTDVEQLITTPAGNFTCVRFMYTEPVYSGILKMRKIAYLWLNNRYGIIKQEVLNPADVTEIQVQELLTKNF